ncbi:MAG: DUF1837 domain-containing protein [Paludibacteraceae bacterium]|nr:DUF1837 domain-containing protein [Paludibacteraceae bacterium]
MAAPFFNVVVHHEDGNRDLNGLCVGFEMKSWRKEQLVNYLMDYIPEFALTYSELKSIDPRDIRRMLRNAAKAIYTSEKYQKRGEFGELLLHVVVRELYNTIPAISKIYYKDSPNDTVKGFDAVHVICHGDELELWLGEVKFYTDINDAINDVVQEIFEHIKSDYLRTEFIAIKNKIDSNWPHADRLKLLLDPNTSLDVVFDKACIPVLLTYDSKVIAKYDRSSEVYFAEITTEFEKLYKIFVEKISNKVPLTIHLFLLPLKTKAELVSCFNQKLKQLQLI